MKTKCCFQKELTLSVLSKLSAPILSVLSNFRCKLVKKKKKKKKRKKKDVDQQYKNYPNTKSI